MAYTKEEKRAYDAAYREKNRERLKREKADYFKRTYDPVKAAENRKTRMPMHLAYCRQPAYKEWKRDYDRRKEERRYGEFAEAWRMLQRLEQAIKEKQPDRNERYREAKRYQWNPAVQLRRRKDAKARRDLKPDRT